VTVLERVRLDGDDDAGAAPPKSTVGAFWICCSFSTVKLGLTL